MKFLLFLGFIGFYFVSISLSFAGTRALWVTRWDFNSPEHIQTIMKQADDLGVDKVLFQVRGNATVYYPSKIEPWAWGINGGDFNTLGVDPGWDPLRTAINAAHQHNLELHAWLNIFPGWRGLQPVPRHVDQVWRTHRSWFMIDHHGKLLRPKATFYTFLSPGIQAVRDHLGSLFHELAANYPDLDGIHMDYVRYPAHKEIGGFRDFSYDPETKALYREQTGKFPRFDDPDWNAFKVRQVADSIRIMRDQAKMASPAIEISATCVAEIAKATGQTGQDFRIWLNEDLVDWVVPMAYKRTMHEFDALMMDLEPHIQTGWKEKMVPGINAASPNFPLDTLAGQIVYCREQGYRGTAVFAYSALFPNGKPNAMAERIKQVWTEDRLHELLMNGGG